MSLAHWTVVALDEALTRWTPLSHRRRCGDGDIQQPYIISQSIHSTSPDGGRQSLGLFGGGTCVSGCPWGSEWLRFNQHRLSSQADRARLLNVVVATWWDVDFKMVMLTLLKVLSFRTFLYVLCFICLIIDLDMPLPRLMEFLLSFNFIEYIFGRRRIICLISLPAHSSLKQPSLALFTVE